MQNITQNKEQNLSTDEIEKCIATLQHLAHNGEMLANLSEEQRIALLVAAGKVSRPNRDEDRKRQKAGKTIRKQELSKVDRAARAVTGIRSARTDAVFKAPAQLQLPGAINHAEAPPLSSPRNCYVCKKEYTNLHFFYDTMCVECGDFNYHKRFQTVDLHGKVAFITGSRLKIGYHVTLMLLRAGVRVIATTRFPVDSAQRFAKEDDFQLWKDRLHIYGLDLRHIPSVEIFAGYVEQTYNRLDILINNAAQTVRRPPGFYAHLMEPEALPYSTLPADVQLLLGNFERCKQQLNAFGKDAQTSEPALPVAWHTQLPGIGLRASAQLSQIPYSFDNLSKITGA